MSDDDSKGHQEERGAGAPQSAGPMKRRGKVPTHESLKTFTVKEAREHRAAKMAQFPPGVVGNASFSPLEIIVFTKYRTEPDYGRDWEGFFEVGKVDGIPYAVVHMWYSLDEDDTNTLRLVPRQNFGAAKWVLFEVSPLAGEEPYSEKHSQWARGPDHTFKILSVTGRTNYEDNEFMVRLELFEEEASEEEAEGALGEDEDAEGKEEAL